MTTVAYTDGACAGNPGPGGWAWAVPGGAYASGCAGHTTNQRMEVQAAYEATQAIQGPLEIVSDSTYVVNCFKNRWYEGWRKNGWLNSQKKPVANRDLWEPFIDLVLQRGDISFRWVKGHSGDAMNDLVDELAVAAGQKQQPASGDKPPARTGIADVITRPGAPAAEITPAAKDPQLPPGHLLLVTGHKPPALGGYDANPLATRVKDKLKEIIQAKAQMNDDLVVVTGLGLGTEQLAAEAANEAGIPVVAVLPYPEQEQVWPTTSQQAYRNLLQASQQEILHSATKPDSRQAAGMAIGKRDAWLARHVQEAVVVWDEKDAQVESVVRSLKDHLGDDEVWIVTPA